MIHTDHANLTRFEYLPLDRIDAKHYRWHAELIQGGCLLLYRPGAGVLHRLPDALSRNPQSRDALNLARIGDWTKHRKVIRGIQQSVSQGELDDEDPPLHVFEVLELGDVVPWENFFKEHFKFKEATDLRIEFFDVNGVVMIQEDFQGVSELKCRTFEKKLRESKSFDKIAAVVVKKMPSESYLFSAVVQSVLPDVCDDSGSPAVAEGGPAEVAQTSPKGGRKVDKVNTVTTCVDESDGESGTKAFAVVHQKSHVIVLYAPQYAVEEDVESWMTKIPETLRPLINRPVRVHKEEPTYLDDTPKANPYWTRPFANSADANGKLLRKTRVPMQGLGSSRAPTS